MNSSTPVFTETTGHDDGFSFRPWFITFGLLGVIDNAFILVIIGYVKYLQNPTNLLIANQSLIDMTTSGLLLTLTIKPGVLYQDRPGLARFTCVFWMSWYPYWSTITASSINLVVIASERFGAVAFPIRYRQKMTKRRTASLSAIPWIYSFCANVYILLFTRIDGNVCLILEWPNKSVKTAMSLTLFILHFAGVIVVVSILYVIIAVHLRGGLSETSKAVTLKERARRNVIRTMLIVFACYVICWAPNDIYVLNHFLNEEGALRGRFYEVTVLIAFGNTWINPVIYSFRYESFQRALRRVFCSKDGRSNQNVDHHQERSIGFSISGQI